MRFKKTLVSLLIFASSFRCDKAPTEMDVNLTIPPSETGDISGVVKWDPDGDGIYTPLNADVALDQNPAAPGSNPEFWTNSNGSGMFEFYNVPVGSHEVICFKFGSGNDYYVGGKDIRVNRGQETSAGTIYLEEYNGSGYGP
jgi:hypothetical protein